MSVGIAPSTDEEFLHFAARISHIASSRLQSDIEEIIQIDPLLYEASELGEQMRTTLIGELFSGNSFDGALIRPAPVANVENLSGLLDAIYAPCGFNPVLPTDITNTLEYIKALGERSARFQSAIRHIGKIATTQEKSSDQLHQIMSESNSTLPAIILLSMLPASNIPGIALKEYIGITNGL